MNIQRASGATGSGPFPLYDGLADRLAAAHQTASADGDLAVAHVLATCAGYAYADVATVVMMMARMGLDANACVEISQTVDAMMIFSTAYLVQSQCGRVAILCYRGTEPGTLGNWLGDVDTGSEASALLGAAEGDPVRVHAGFHLNLRATWLGVLEQLELALEGKSVAVPDARVAQPLQALYVTGHSLGGAMAVLFGLSIARSRAQRAIADKLRAIYTFGQPMATCAPLPAWAAAAGSRVFRYVIPRDLIPALPPASWGPFTHIGQEYRYADGAWRASATPVTPLTNVREIPRALLAFMAPQKKTAAYRYAIGDHRPQNYIASLRPTGMISELGD
jgi:hypothetical protein